MAYDNPVSAQGVAPQQPLKTTAAQAIDLLDSLEARLTSIDGKLFGSKPHPASNPNKLSPAISANEMLAIIARRIDQLVIHAGAINDQIQ